MSGGWSITDHLLANLIELVDESNRLAFYTATGGKRQLRDPLNIPRPPRDPRERPRSRQATPAEVSAFFSGA